MRAAALLLLLLSLPAGAGEITFVGPGGIREEPDPRLPVPALRADRESFATLIAPDVGLFVAPSAGGPAYVSNLIGGALVRRFAGHIEPGRALGSGRVFTLTAHLTERRAVVVADWRLTDEQGRDVGAVFSAARMSGPGRDFAAFAPPDAERLAFQAAALLLDAPMVSEAIRDAAALARIERSPSPPARPAPEG